MKKKNKLKKVIIILVVIALVVGIAAFALTRNNDEVEIELVDIPIITFFGITGDTTTELDIIKVERDLNNVLITDGYAVKLFLAPEERYDTMIESAKTMMDAYIANNKKSAAEKFGFEYKFDYETSTFTYKCDKDAVTPNRVYNQDTIIELLDDGIENRDEDKDISEYDIYPNVPSIDVMLVTDYDDYFEMSKNGEFERLNSALTDIAKSLKQSIPNAFFEALKLNNSGDIFGVPSVQVVGEYEFLVFDKDLLNKYGDNENKIKSVEDLNDYLKKVYEDDSVNAYPLLNAPQTSPLELSEGKGIGITVNGALEIPFTKDDYYNYYATIARYRSLGYMAEVGADILDSDFAVAFFSGTEEEVKALSEKTGKNLVYNKFSMPYALSKEVGEAVFCVCAEKKYSVSSSEHGIDFVCKLNAPVSQTDIKNILLYGALGINYSISDTDGYVEYAKGNTYSMGNLYTGHTLHAHPSIDKGVSAEWIASAQAHNLELLTSKLSGFKYEPRTFSVESVSGESIKVVGPDYLKVIDNIVSEFYIDYINGITGEVDLEDFNARVDGLIREDIKKTVTAAFEKAERARLSEGYEAEVRADEALMTKYQAEAETNAVYELKEGEGEDSVKSILTAEFKKIYANQNVTDPEEIALRLSQDITAELIEERFAEMYTEEEIAEAISERLAGYVKVEVEKKLNEYATTDAYISTVNNYTSSAAFNAIVEERFAKERDTAYYKFLDSEIEDKLMVFSDELTAKIEAALIAENEKFLAENKGKVKDSELADLNLTASYDDLLTNVLRNQYYELKGEPK